MISIIVPAHNEEAVIGRCLEALTSGCESDELEVIVCCNACVDQTAMIAKRFGAPVRVVESNIPSKTHAMNLGDEVARGFPRIYVDADVILPLQSVRELARVLEQNEVLAVAPSVRTVYPPDSTWAVRAYYDFWMALPYIQEGMMAAGVYGLSRSGRARFNQFPDVIADDGFVRLQFTSDERVEAASALSTVSAPSKFADLIKIKTRSRLGVYQLKIRFPEHFLRESKSKQYGKALLALARIPRLYAAAVPYLWVNFVSRYRARRQLSNLEAYVWERDNSSRTASADPPS